MIKSGTKNVVAIKESIKNIETLTARFKRKRLTQEQYILLVNQNLSKMTDERNYIEYLVNIGQY
jgi:hypothetical protein